MQLTTNKPTLGPKKVWIVGSSIIKRAAKRSYISRLKGTQLK